MKIYALVISYNPNISQLKASVNSLSKQVEKVIIVDNGSSNFSEIQNIDIPNIETIGINSNVGIAEATNIGINRIEEYNSDFILFSDQDTLYPGDYVEKAISFFENHKDSNIACITPAIFDTTTETIKSIYVLNKSRITKVSPKTNTDVIQTIASGLIVRTDYLLIIGGMKTDLFIDYVDYEWCWRCNDKGFRIVYLDSIQINHSLGDNYKLIFGRKISIRNSVRYYYIIRNTLYLALKTKYLPQKARFQLFKQAFIYFLCYISFMKGQPKLMIKAIYDGFCGNLGKLNN